MNTKELDLRVILAVFRRQLVWILVMAVLGAFVAFLIANYLIPPKYTSNTQVLITTRQADSVSLSDLTTSKSMASTYCVLLTSSAAKERLKILLTEDRYADILAEKEEAGEILSEEDKTALEESVSRGVSSDVSGCSITAKVVNSTEIVELTVVSGSATLSAKVCATLTEVAKEWIPEIYGPDSSSTTLKEKIEPSSSPSSPNISMCIALGAAAGMVLVCAMAFLVYLSDNRVKDEADFVAKVGIPVLGAVPNMDETREKKEGGYYAYNYPKKKEQ